LSAAPFFPYRYTLWRIWQADGPQLAFVGLNPSTADETVDDPTIRRCIDFAKQWGYGSLCMLNLFAFRATDPKVMKLTIDPVGPENDKYLLQTAEKCRMTVAAWGIHGVYRQRAKKVIKLLPPLWCLGVTDDGHPRHPLYMRKDSQLLRYGYKHGFADQTPHAQPA
jgi:hypothetical protein